MGSSRPRDLLETAERVIGETDAVCFPFDFSTPIKFRASYDFEVQSCRRVLQGARLS